MQRFEVAGVWKGVPPLQEDLLPLTYRDLHASRQYREQHGLLTNDSLIIAVMQRERIQLLATNDLDFERIPGIAVRTPGA